jgi:mRNA interferase MazF
VKRGDVYWYGFPKPDKVRPVVVLTSDDSIPRLNAVVVASITRTIRHVPTEVVLGPEDGMRGLCAVNLHQLRTVMKKDLQTRIAALDESRMQELREAVIVALGI